EDSYEGELENPLSLNLYTYVHNNPLTNIDPTGHWCTATVNGKYYSHPGQCSGSGNGQDYISDDNAINFGRTIYNAGEAVGTYYPEGSIRIEGDPTGISDALIGCAYDNQCAGFVTGGVTSAANGVKEGVKAVGIGTARVLNWSKEIANGKPKPNPGIEFNPYGSRVQTGVDPNTLVPAKDLKNLTNIPGGAQRVTNAVKHGGDKPIIVDRNGKILDGHHRVYDAIRKGRTVDVQIGY
ncbi:hypothetical protein, partial [Xylanibacillus composti]